MRKFLIRRIYNKTVGSRWPNYNLTIGNKIILDKLSNISILWIDWKALLVEL
jgi:hypothetical protein